MEVKFKWSRPTNKSTSECDQVFLYEVDDPDYTPCCVDLPPGCNSGELSIEGPPNAGLYGLGIRGYQSVDGEEEEVVLYRGAPFMCTACGPYKIKIKLLKPTVELQESVSLSYEIPREASVESVSFGVRMLLLGDDDQVGAYVLQDTMQQLHFCSQCPRVPLAVLMDEQNVSLPWL